jgi:hypothetical protein
VLTLNVGNLKMNFANKTAAEKLFDYWSRDRQATREDLEKACQEGGARKEYFIGWGVEADAWIFPDNSWIEMALNEGPISAHFHWEGSPKKKT